MTETRANSMKNQKAALGFEPRITVLQTAALPLGYAAINPVRKGRCSEPKTCSQDLNLITVSAPYMAMLSNGGQ